MLSSLQMLLRTVPCQEMQGGCPYRTPLEKDEQNIHIVKDVHYRFIQMERTKDLEHKLICMSKSSDASLSCESLNPSWI